MSEEVFWKWRPETGLLSAIRSDWRANRDSQKGRLVMVMFRVASWFRRTHPITYVLGYPYLIFYRISVEWLLGVEIPPLTRIEPGLGVHHGQGVVVNNRTIIGPNCLIRQGVTLGNKNRADPFGCPVLKSGATIGANALVLGRVIIGSEATVGAGAVVLKDVRDGCVVVGNPAREISGPEDLEQENS